VSSYDEKKKLFSKKTIRVDENTIHFFVRPAVQCVGVDMPDFKWSHK